MGPITNHVVDQLAKLVEADGLLEVGVHAKAISFVNIALLAGTAEHDPSDMVTRVTSLQDEWRIGELNELNGLN